MNEKKYLVIDTPDEYICVFDSAEEATAEAERIWNHFVKSEQTFLKARLTMMAILTGGFNSGGHDYDGCFDSEFNSKKFLK